MVECRYLNDNELEEPFRWSCIKTRYDKTYNVDNYQKNYGNYSNVANRVFSTIMESLTYDQISSLSNESLYEKTMARILEKKDIKTYYEKETNLGGSLRIFHNWIKTYLISNYLSNISTLSLIHI